jgi:hypothetical protein
MIMGWNLSDLTARTGSPLATPSVRNYFNPSPIFGQFAQQYLVYAGLGDDHIHELAFSSPLKKWSHTDLTDATSAPLAISTPTGYAWGSSRSVLYLTGDNHIHQFRSDGNDWHDTDLTTAAGAPLTSNVPEGYFFPTDNSQHIVYLASDNHIHELVGDLFGNAWSENDLSVAAGGELSEGRPTGHIFQARRTQHVIYSGTDNHIHELWANISGWHHNDLTAATGAPSTPPGGKLARGYVFEAQLTQHIPYPAVDRHIHELRWDLQGWHNDDLNVATGAPEWAPPGFSTGYVFDAEGTEHVTYVGLDDHIHELWRDSSAWHHNDLTAATGAPKAASELTGYVYAFEGSQHVVYVGPDNHIIELWWLP